MSSFRLTGGPVNGFVEHGEDGAFLGVVLLAFGVKSNGLFTFLGVGVWTMTRFLAMHFGVLSPPTPSRACFSTVTGGKSDFSCVNVCRFLPFKDIDLVLNVERDFV